jgi:YaaC-like Protein
VAAATTAFSTRRHNTSPSLDDLVSNTITHATRTRTCTHEARVACVMGRQTPVFSERKEILGTGSRVPEFCRPLGEVAAHEILGTGPRVPRAADHRHFDGEPPPTIIGSNGRANLFRSLPPKGRDPDQLCTQETMWRDNQTWLIPKLGGIDGPPHVLVLWWALLFALSMRARYEPEGWTKDLDPDDQSAIAVTLKPCSTCPWEFAPS